MAAAIKVLIVDDHEIVRRGIRALLANKTDIEVVGEAGDGAGAITQARALKPDVVLMDLVMPVMDGIQATKEITSRKPCPGILVLTSFAEQEQVVHAVKAGALGYLLKDAGPQELLDAVRKVARGEPSLDPSVARTLLSEMAKPPQGPLTRDPLTAREMEVLRLIAHGHSNREIAGHLSISEETVHAHVGNILGKLHVASRTQAALYALKEGIATLDDLPQNG